MNILMKIKPNRQRHRTVNYYTLPPCPQDPFEPQKYKIAKLAQKDSYTFHVLTSSTDPMKIYRLQSYPETRNCNLYEVILKKNQVSIGWLISAPPPLEQRWLSSSCASRLSLSVSLSWISLLPPRVRIVAP